MNIKMIISILGIIAGCALGFWWFSKSKRPIADNVIEIKSVPQISQNPPCDKPIDLNFFITHEENVDFSDYDFTIRISSEVAYHGKYQNPIKLQSYCPDLSDEQVMISFEAQEKGKTNAYSWYSIKEYAADLKDNQDVKVKLLAQQNTDGDTYEMKILPLKNE
jgi:hypothetical protein